MGILKRLYLKLNNKKLYPKIKTYCFYKKDIWGIIRWRRRMKYKRVILSFMKGKRKFYNRILYGLYKGVKYFVKKYNYRGNLFFTKQRLKLFYGFLREKQYGKLKELMKNKKGDKLNTFFSVLERRLDVILVRALYFRKILTSRRYIKDKNIFVNNECIVKINKLINVGDIVYINSRPNSFEFFLYVRKKHLNIMKLRKKLVNRYAFELYKTGSSIIYGHESKVFKLFLKKFKISKYNFFYNFMKIMSLVVRFYLFYKRLLYNFYEKKKHKKKKLRFKGKLIELYSIFLKKKMKLLLLLILIDYDIYSTGKVILYKRWKKFFKLLKPKLLKQNTNFFEKKILLQQKINDNKQFRFWKLSKKALLRLLKISQSKKKKFRPVWSGFPPYMEVNYKNHSLILVKKPKVNMIKYPFTANHKLFYDVWRNKGFI